MSRKLNESWKNTKWFIHKRKYIVMQLLILSENEIKYTNIKNDGSNRGFKI